VEHLVAASCILASGARLNVSTSLVDDEGVDVVFHRRGGVATIAAQIKSRTTTAKGVVRGHFSARVRVQTFRSRSDLYMLFAIVDAPTATVGPVWFVPSADFEQGAVKISRGLLAFNASTSEHTKDQWRRYRLDGVNVPARLAQRVLELLDGPANQQASVSLRSGAKRRPLDLVAINRALQELACSNPEGRVTAVEAGRFLEGRRLLRDRRKRAGSPLRGLLRRGLVKNAYQEDDRWWFIACDHRSP
jgi:hypothetical protein